MIISTRYGVSFNTRHSTSGQPERCPTVETSGGSDQPVNHGESARAIHPEGAIRNATPIAIAACGVARIGATTAPARFDQARP